MARQSKRRQQKTTARSGAAKAKGVLSQKSRKSSTPLNFQSLPPEVRNTIYRLCIDTGQVLTITDMHPDEYDRRSKAGFRLQRLHYAAPDHARGSCGECPEVSVQCRSHGVETAIRTTTYDLLNADKTAISLLASNRKIRSEAASLFYGANIFTFKTMTSVVPFLKDRPPDTRKFISSIQLDLHIYEWGWFPCVVEFGRPEAWSRAFTALKKLPYVNLRKISISIEDRHHLLHHRMRWLNRLGDVRGLDSLGVRYIDYFLAGSQNMGPLPPVKIRSPTVEDKIWSTLAPRMLAKVEGEDHSAKGLRHREISWKPDPNVHIEVLGSPMAL